MLAVYGQFLMAVDRAQNHRGLALRRRLFLTARNERCAAFMMGASWGL